MCQQPHEHGETGEEGVETPVLSEVGNDDRPNRFAGQHCPPGGVQLNLDKIMVKTQHCN